MKIVIRENKKDTVSSEFVSMSKIYIYANEGGVYKLCKLGDLYDWSWVNISGTYKSDVKNYDSMQKAVESKIDENVMEFADFTEFIFYHSKNRTEKGGE